ncbi:unnamed protein product [Ixodes pacificus]
MLQLFLAPHKVVFIKSLESTVCTTRAGSILHGSAAIAGARQKAYIAKFFQMLDRCHVVYGTHCKGLTFVSVSAFSPALLLATRQRSSCALASNLHRKRLPLNCKCPPSSELLPS